MLEDYKVARQHIAPSTTQLDIRSRQQQVRRYVVFNYFLSVELGCCDV